MTFAICHEGCGLHLAVIDTIAYLGNNKKEVSKQKQNKQKEIEDIFGKETYLYSLDSWSIQAKAFAHKEIVIGVFNAIK